LGDVEHGLNQAKEREMHKSHTELSGNFRELTAEEMDSATGGRSDMMNAVVRGLAYGCFESYGGPGPGGVCAKLQNAVQ
jgi:hypothetical protein